MSKRIPDKVKRQAIGLRVDERLGIDEIRRRAGLSQGTLSTLLQDYPLGEKEVRERVSRAAVMSNVLRKYNPEQSKFAAMVEGKDLSTDRKGHIAEAAVLFRLELQGYEVWRPPEGSRVDYIVSRPGSDRYVRLQVKWAKQQKKGRPLFALGNGEHGKIRRLTQTNCDFVVGYDLETDTAFVVPIVACEGKGYKACDEKYAEAWHLLGI